MKLKHGRSTRGGILVAMLIFTALVGGILVAYLSMVSSKHKMSFRSQVWNLCIPMCEAGVEEAMAHINWGGTGDNFGSSGWQPSGSAFYKERALNDGTMQMRISTDIPPIVTVTARLPGPVSSKPLERTVRAKTMIFGTFPNAFLAAGPIRMGGNNARVDSFNSTNALESTNGQYDPAKATDDVIVTSLGSTAGTVSVGNISIYGQVATRPGGTVTINPQGNVGSTLWNDDPIHNGQIEAGAVRDDANVFIPAASLPSGFAPMTPTSGRVNGTNYAYILTDGDWILPSVNLNNGGILIAGKARIHVTGNTVIGTGGFIEVASGGSVQWYSSGSIDFSGKGVVNGTGLAKDFSMIGLPSCTSVQYGGQSKFVGTIYAPSASVSLTGLADASGALVGKDISIGGGMNFHYDVALNAAPTPKRYFVSSWQEL